MKLNCGPTYKEKLAAKKEWHKKFLWWPTRIGSHDCRWLETVWRKGKLTRYSFDAYWTWEYMVVV